ncbi:MAG: hypothetical protein RM368_36145 [Nostoc sp. DedSLP03]|uniref:hypothetical protein n=1 Tax=Nostoc sp. DedSLP03 TaxID=3075400 RepID=UPI002AD574ED|nr:hypothetical protein [Nostoc sp. DedSLP03]MDZ7970303.1 hypothetical protein [Nostoc sp. DedSLP03]
MQVKSISYHRVINLGNYESKRLELFAEVQEGEDPEAAISSLAELVERKARESFELIFDIKELKRERRELSQEVDRLKAEKDKLTGVEADPDDIPFDQMSQAQLDEVNKNF